MIKHESLFPAVAPTIRVRKQPLEAKNGASVLLECLVEAYPPALTYWMAGESRMIESNWKYRVTHTDTGASTSRSLLNITHVESADYSSFKCVAKNERGRTEAVLTVFGTITSFPRPFRLPNYLFITSRPRNRWQQSRGLAPQLAARRIPSLWSDITSPACRLSHVS